MAFNHRGASSIMAILFPFQDHWRLYAGFGILVLLLLPIDLGVLNRKAHTISFREAGATSLLWASLAIAFCYGLINDCGWLRCPAYFGALNSRGGR